MSSGSSIGDLVRYRRTRFPLVLFLPLSLFLTLATAVGEELPTLPALAVRALLAVLWLFQFRLADDLADGESDRRDHPDRVLTRADARPFVGLLVALAAVNTGLTCWLRSAPHGAAFLGLTALFALWYAARRSRSWPLVVLLKYPAFVYLLSDSWTGTVPVLVYACFVVYEVLHDRRLASAPGITAQLALAMLVLTAAGAALVPPTAVGRCALVAGGAVLVWLFRRHLLGHEPGKWPYAVFIVCSSWIACAIRM